MKKLIVLSAAIVLNSASSFALVRLVTNCKTSDGLYAVVITDNQGIGPVRTSNFGASINDQDGNTIASYAVQPDDGIRSISFGRQKYLDKETDGHKFSLAFPSTNYRHTSLLAVLPDGQVLRDENMACSPL
jgi:hypothetical protein